MKRTKKAALMLSAALILSAVPSSLVPGRFWPGPHTALAGEREDAWKKMDFSEWEVVRKTNQERKKAGLEPLSVTGPVQNGARIRIGEVAQQYGHTRPDGTSFGTVMGENGTRITGENIAAGFSYSGSVMEGWMDSTGHRENILNSRYRHIGVGRSGSSWEQLFTYCDNGSNTGTRILADEETPVVVDGTPLESLKYLIQFTCSGCHETAWIPITSDMCTGYNPNTVGTQTVTVSYKSWKGTFPVTVRAKRLVERIEMSPTSDVTLRVGESVRLYAEAFPDTADSLSFEWCSTASNVAMAVTANGEIRAFQAGTTEIYCRARDDGRAESARCKITVIQPVTSITLNGRSAHLRPGDEVQLYWSVWPKNAGDNTVKWYSSDPQAASVDQNGKIKALAEGDADIYCVAQDGSEVRSYDYKVRVDAVNGGNGSSASGSSTDTGSSTNIGGTSSGSAGTASGLVQGLKITPIDINCTVGYQTNMSVTVTPGAAADKSVTWYSTDTDVASVDSRGRMRAVSEGSAEIYCMSADGGDITSNRCQVTVRSSGGSSGSSSGSSSSKGSSGSSSGNKGSATTSGRTLPSYVVRGNWGRRGNDWIFTDSSGRMYQSAWAAVENPYASAALGQQGFDWFRFDDSGKMMTGWFLDPSDGYWYYLNPISDNTLGRMMTGWQIIDGTYYYFNPNSDGHRGRMYAGETTPDGYYVDGNGRWIP